MAKKKKLPKIIQDIRRYKVPPIDWNNQKIISHTQMTIFNQCPFRWGSHYRDGHKTFTPGIALIFGIAIHEVIQDYIVKFYEESKAAADRMDMEVIFKDRLRSLYKENFDKNNRVHFSTVDELDEHCIDGLEIIRYFKSKVGTYFSKKGWYLVGIEVPVTHSPIQNVLFNGSLDIVLYHEPTNTIEIIDLKTSTKSWGKYQKSDQNKLAQIILYKKIFSEQFAFPIENIEVKFLILKRKLLEDCDFQQKRIQEFIPASGKNKVKVSVEMLDNFAFSIFNELGKFIQDKLPKKPSPNNCKFCPYNNKEDICDKNKAKNKWRDPFTTF